MNINNWHIWQDSPRYGCVDNPSYDWFARRSSNGHIMETMGPYPDVVDLFIACEGMTPKRAGEVLKQQAQWPHWGNARKFMTKDEFAHVNALWGAWPNGNVSFMDMLYHVARRQ